MNSEATYAGIASLLTDRLTFDALQSVETLALLSVFAAWVIWGKSPEGEEGKEEGKPAEGAALPAPPEGGAPPPAGPPSATPPGEGS